MVNAAIDVTGTGRTAVGRDDVTDAGSIDADAAIETVQLDPEGTIDTPSANVDITTDQSVNL